MLRFNRIIIIHVGSKEAGLFTNYNATHRHTNPFLFVEISQRVGRKFGRMNRKNRYCAKRLNGFVLAGIGMCSGMGIRDELLHHIFALKNSDISPLWNWKWRCLKYRNIGSFARVTLVRVAACCIKINCSRFYWRGLFRAKMYPKFDIQLVDLENWGR